MAEAIEGHCLCGAVRITAEAGIAGLSACHCSLCRRWTGAAQWGFSVPERAARITGAVARYRATPFSERAWCPACGTHLWLRDDGGDYEFVPGLFDAAAGAPLHHEVYADRAMACVRLEGSHPRISRVDYEMKNPHVEGETT